jgi:hypothetical protein
VDSGFFVVMALCELGTFALLPAILIGAGIGWAMARKNTRRAKWVYSVNGGLVPFFIGLCAFDVCFFLGTLGGAAGWDLGFGDRFDLPLRNGYHFTAQDTTTDAVVYKFEWTNDGSWDSIGNGPDTVWNVRQLQEHGDWLAGYYSDSGSFILNGNGGTDWFLLNTRTGDRVDPASEDALRADAAAKGFALQLQPTSDFYFDRSFGVVDVLKMLAEVLLPLAVVVFWWKLSRWFLRRSVVALRPISGAFAES